MAILVAVARTYGAGGRRRRPMTGSMWPFLDKPRSTPATVCFRGPIAPPVEQVLAPGVGDVAAAAPTRRKASTAAWAVRLTHPAWGEAVVIAPRGRRRARRRRDPLGHAGADRRRARRCRPRRDRAARAGDDAGAQRAARPQAPAALAAPADRARRARRHRPRRRSCSGRRRCSTTSWRTTPTSTSRRSTRSTPIYDDTRAEPAVYWLHTHGLEALGAFDIDVAAPVAGCSRSTSPIRCGRWPSRRSRARSRRDHRLPLGNPAASSTSCRRRLRRQRRPGGRAAALARRVPLRAPRRRLRAARAFGCPAPQADPVALPRNGSTATSSSTSPSQASPS